MSALLVVDVQNDFLEGSLALRNCPAGQDGMGVIPAINSVLDLYFNISNAVPHNYKHQSKKNKFTTLKEIDIATPWPVYH